MTPTPVEMPNYGNKVRTTIILDRDQAEYIEERAKRERTSNATIVRRAVDLMIEKEPLGEAA